MSDNPCEFLAVVFDMDGILIDSEPLFRAVAQQAAKDLGHQISDSLFNSWMGLPPNAVGTSIIQSMGENFPMDAFRTRFRELWISHTESHGVPAQPGIDGLLSELQSQHIPFGVATSTQRDQAEHSLRLAGLWPYIDTLVAGNEVANGKPDPEIFLSVAERLGIEPTRCIALEDSEAGVRSASSAHMLTIMVPDLHQPTIEVATLANYILPTTAHAARVILAMFDER